MPTDLTQPHRRQSLRLDLIALAAVGMVCAIGISLGYGFGYEFICRDVFPAALCQGLSFAVPRALCAVVLIGLFLLVRDDRRRSLYNGLRPKISGSGLLILLLGLAMVLAPLAWLWTVGALMAPTPMMTLWLGGLAVGAIGLIHTLYAPDRLRDPDGPLRQALLPLSGLALLGLVLPDLALLLQPVWRADWLTDFTFRAVEGGLSLLGQNTTSYFESKTLLIDDFGVAIGPECSGVEGFALITVFTAFYIALFRDQLRLARALLILPVAIVLSWVLNVIRISVLMLMGRHISPDLAINGFHSHAGWLMFLLLAFGIAVAAHHINWFQKPVTAAHGTAATSSTAPARPGFFEDLNVVFLLPFAVFMASSTLVSALSETPGLLYPVRMALVAGVLSLAWGAVRRLAWRVDPLAVGAGAICGVLWLVFAPPASSGESLLADRLGALPAILLAAWVFIRLLGTSLVVPLVEEFFFRGYLLTRLDRGGLAWRILALAVTSLAFGLLHDRLIAGTAAGLLFGIVALRNGRVTDAVICHATANAVIAGYALFQGDFSVI